MKFGTSFLIKMHTLRNWRCKKVRGWVYQKTAPYRLFLLVKRESKKSVVTCFRKKYATFLVKVSRKS
jgi:hypothetical protein